MPLNGDVNHHLGTYRTMCCGAEIVIAENATFPYCPNHFGTTVWKFLSTSNEELARTAEVEARTKDAGTAA